MDGVTGRGKYIALLVLLGPSLVGMGAFYILPVGTEQDSQDYGGTYDKSTMDKVARVVVTIDYNLER